MKLENNTVLITGGSSGIGLELANVLIEKGNKVIICGRSTEKLTRAVRGNPKLHNISCDISDPEACEDLFLQIGKNFPECNMLFNNAAVVSRTSFKDDPEMIAKATFEVETNLLAPIRLSKLFIPLLESKPNGAIVNVTTGLAYVPRKDYPIYNATKAALHSFTQTLRHQLNGSSLRVFEAMFPVVDTPWHDGNVPKIAIQPAEAVRELIKGLELDKPEIRIGKVKVLYTLSRIAPGFASRMINSIE